VRICLGILDILVNAEARVHGVEREKVHFMNWRMSTRSSTSSVWPRRSLIRIGRSSAAPSRKPGFIKHPTALLRILPGHGEILHGMNLVFYEKDLELTTPTGAAILKYYAGNPKSHARRAQDVRVVSAL